MRYTINMKKRWKIIGFTLVGLIFALLLGAIILLSRSEHIGKLAIQALNQQIEGEVKVERAVITFWSYFPNAAIQLRHIYVTDAKGEVLLRADKLSFRINPFKLLEGKIILNAFRLSNGSIRINHYQDGTWSHDIIQSNSSTSKSAKVQFALKKGFLEYCTIGYHNDPANHHTDWYITKANLDINYQSERLELDLVSHGVIDYLHVNDLNLANDQSFKLALSLDAYLDKGIYQLKPSIIQMSGNQVSLSGDLHFNSNQQYYNLTASCVRGKLQEFLNLLPEKQRTYLGLFNPQGIVDFDLTYKGILREDLQPELSGQLHIEHGALYNSAYLTSINQIQLDAALQSSLLNTQIRYSVQGLVEETHSFESKGLLDLNDYPSYDIFCSGVLPAALLLKWSEVEGIESAEGNINFIDVHLISGPKYNSSFTGQILAQNLSALVQQQPLVLSTVETRITDQGLMIDTFDLSGLGSSIRGRCILSDYNVLLPTMDGIAIDANLYAYSVNWNQWNDYLNRILPKDSLQDDQAFFQVLLNKDIAFHATLTAFRWDDLIIDQLQGYFLSQQGNLQANCDIEAFGGKLEISANGKVHAKGMDLQLFSATEQVDIHQLMLQTRNMGQDFIKAQHLKGQLTSKVIAEMHWTQNGTFNGNDLHAVSAVRIDQGELIRFPLLEDFSAFVKVEDLRHVRFTALHNLLEIRRSTITIPEIFIQSNAVNMNLAGTHTFQQQMDYGIMVNAGQVLGTKFKKHNPTLKPIQARKKGFVNLYYRISGFPDNVLVQIDRPGYDRIHENAAIRKEVIRKKLIEHFGPSDLFDTATDRAPDFFDDKSSIPDEYVQFSN